MTNPRMIVDLLDADDCVYHKDYNSLLIYLAATYGDTVVALHAAHMLAQQNVDDPGNDAKIQKLIADIQAFPLTQLPDAATIASMKEELIGKGREQLHRLRDQLRAKLLAEHKKSTAVINAEVETCYPQHSTDAELYTAQMNHYIGIMNILDPGLMGSIMLQANPALLEHMSSHSDPHTVQLVGLGADRQTYDDDLEAMKSKLTGSIFNDLFYLSQHLHTSLAAKNIHVGLQPLTIADIPLRRPSGDHFRRVVTNHYGKQASCVSDKSKFAYLYANVCDVSTQYPDTDITINFYEHDKDVIDGLYATFHDYPTLLPKKVTLVIHQYDGELRMTLPKISGENTNVDEFRDNVSYLYSLAKSNPDRAAGDSINIVKDVNIKEFLANRKYKASNKSLAALLDADGCIYNHKYYLLLFSLIKKYGDVLAKMAENPDETSKANFGEQLINEITATDDTAFSQENCKELGAYRYEHDLEKQELADTYRQHVGFLRKINPVIIDAMLYRANQKLFTGLGAKAKQQNCDSVMLFVGSNRQSMEDDLFNLTTNGGGLYFEDLERFIKYLNTRQQGEVPFALNHFLLADLYSDVAPGESYRRALQNYDVAPDPYVLENLRSGTYVRDFLEALVGDGENLPFTVFDETKASMIYGFLHYIARTYPNISQVEFYDDRNEILESVHKFFGKNDQYGFLPKGLKLQLIPYPANVDAPQPELQITGSGAVDRDVDLSIQLLATLCDVDFETYPDARIQVDVASTKNIQEAFKLAREAETKPAMIQFDELTANANQFLKAKRNFVFFKQHNVVSGAGAADKKTVAARA